MVILLLEPATRGRHDALSFSEGRRRGQSASGFRHLLNNLFCDICRNLFCVFWLLNQTNADLIG